MEEIQKELENENFENVEDEEEEEKEEVNENFNKIEQKVVTKPELSSKEKFLIRLDIEKRLTIIQQYYENFDIGKYDRNSYLDFTVEDLDFEIINIRNRVNSKNNVALLRDSYFSVLGFSENILCNYGMEVKGFTKLMEKNNNLDIALKETAILYGNILPQNPLIRLSLMTMSSLYQYHKSNTINKHIFYEAVKKMDIDEELDNEFEDL